MRTICDVIRWGGGCLAQEEIFKGRTDFKRAFYEIGRARAGWVLDNLFYRARPKHYPEINLPMEGMYQGPNVFQNRETRMKYWPAVRRRLGELGVKRFAKFAPTKGS
jgi:hypothetical protein